MIETLEWSEPKEVTTSAGPRLIKTAPPSEKFWELYREYRDILREAGVSPSKFQNNWTVNWWQRNGEFITPNLPVEVEEEIPILLDLPPLVNEKNLLSFQIALTQQSVRAMREFGSSINGCGTGVGKTFITLGACRELGLRPIVVCPKIITPDWIRAAFLMGVELAGVHGWEWIKTGKTPFGSWEESKGRKKFGNFTWNVPDDSVIVWDEAHRAGAIDTQNARLVICAAEQKIKSFFLSATLANDPTKLRAVGFALGLHNDGKDFYKWMLNHGVKKQEFQVGRRKVIAYKFKGTEKDLKKVHSSIFPHKGCRVRADQLGDAFPSTQILAKAYDMEESPEIAREYEIMKQRVDEIMCEKSGSEMQACILVEMLRARQAVELLKVPLIVSLTKDHVEEGNSVFIAINFKDTLFELVKLLKIKSIIVGGQNEHTRRNAIDDFQSNKNHIIIGTIPACREGVSLHDLNGRPRVALISPPQSANQLKQVLGRTHRAGGKSPSLQRILFAANTIEEQVAESLATKLDQIDLLMDGHLSPSIFPEGYSDMREEEEQ